MALAAAAIRLRKRPGRPRKKVGAQDAAVTPSEAEGVGTTSQRRSTANAAPRGGETFTQNEFGHIPGAVASRTRSGRGSASGAMVALALAPGAPAMAGPWPRLLDLRSTARYLSLSVWSVRELQATGTLRPVRVPMPMTDRRQGDTFRKLLYDRADLDRLIDEWKRTG